MNDATATVKSQLLCRGSLALGRAGVKEGEVPGKREMIIPSHYGKTIGNVGNDLLRLLHFCWKNVTLKGIRQI